ncbi:MAG: homoserine dehydrogenase [Oscillospiraceae bacterium]|nr:homoserine dehydrogenase [Oscillospiraceae bacterium]
MTKFAVLGHGVVGSGTVELFLKNKDKINQKCGLELELGRILDLRDFPGLPYSDKFTKDINDILNDDEITVVAEVMGGVNPAFEFVSGCLKAGKSVCTSNKELVAKKGAELISLAKENNCNFMFEASTGGAIPIIRPLHTCLAANEITAAAGILNGTTNFILTKMLTDNMTLDDALAMAQRLGYAERNPAADVEGHDACRKICILSSLIFGKHVYPDWVHVEGITGITTEDAEYAVSFGGAVKLIGKVTQTEDGKILPMVSPAFVCSANPLSHVDDVFNGIMVFGDGFGEAMFYGRGAGKLPTASAVLGDVIDCAKHKNTIRSLTWEDSADNSFIADYKDSETRMYIRLENCDKQTVEAAFPDCEYLSRKNQPANEFAIVTPSLKEREIDEKLENIGGKVLGKIRILDL